MKLFKLIDYKPPKCCWRFGLHRSPKRSLRYGVFPQTPAALRAASSMDAILRGDDSEVGDTGGNNAR